ncbi:MAG TPA: methylmalonyl Co-A mutase-associated GTPase MeaB [Terracidiphilus sp.]
MTDANKTALHIQPGCAVPEPAARRRREAKQRQDISPARLIEGIRTGDRSVLAKAITLVESSRPEDRKIAELIIENCQSANVNSIRVGITGAPGAGKSTLIEALGKYLIKERRENVAVLAIDPSSQLSGGSILGDKTRMTFLSSSEMAFVRPTPSRGVHGGVARHTRDAILLCEAAGFRNILIETVGVGQSEAAVRDMVDFFLLVTMPGAGDELQGIKRGVMEIVDLVAVNKADGDRLQAAELARTEAENALHFMPVPASGWKPRVLACSAQTGHGVADLWLCVLNYVELTGANGSFQEERCKQARHSMHEILEQELTDWLRADPVLQERISVLEQEVAAGRVTASCAVRELIVLFAKRASELT